MKKTYHAKKTLLLWTLATTMTITHMTSPAPYAVHAQEIYDTEETMVSLSDTSAITVDTAGTRLCIYGEEDTTYHVPVSITADCTVILDHVCNLADITVADGVDAEIFLRGTNMLHDICAQGGSASHVSIRGTSSDDKLTANQIACPDGGSNTATGAEVLIENCTVKCTDLASGGDGKDTSFYRESTKVAGSSPGSNASPYVTIRSADLTVDGNIACGGNGLLSKGTRLATASDGGSSGEVYIDSSRVTVGKNIAMGGKGGDGVVNTEYFDCRSGATRSASPVTICNHSTVNVSGNVASQHDLSYYSNGGNAAFHGVTVTVCDSALTATDIASGGSGHECIRYSDYSDPDRHIYISGTAGGNGGTLVATRAKITCETAVCGGKAGDYQHYDKSTNGDLSGDYNCINHPLDGNGGVICSDNSDLVITDTACEKGNRWNGYNNASTYSDCVFLGGTLSGTVHGSIITTDMTSLLDGHFEADIAIQNSEGVDCFECVLQTDTDMSGQTIQICANELSETTTLDDTGRIRTYLSMGSQTLKLSGTSTYTGTIIVKRITSLNNFQMNACGKIYVDHGDAIISENTYTCQDKTYPYSGTYTITGQSENAVLTVVGGTHQLLLHDTSFDTLNVKGTSEVILRPDGFARIGIVNVEEHAVLTVTSLGGIYTDTSGFSIGKCNGILQNETGARMYPVDILFEKTGTYCLMLNEEALTVKTDENGLAHVLLAAGDYAFRIEREPFYFLENLSVNDAMQLAQTDMALCADISKGDLIIEDHTVTLGGHQIQSDTDVSIIQSTAEAHAVYIEKKDAIVTIENPPADLQLHLPEDFEGRLSNTSKVSLQIVTAHTAYPDQELTLKLDDHEYSVTTDSKGDFSFLASAGKHSVEITVAGTTYRSIHPFSVSESESNSFSITDNMTSDPNNVPDTDPIEGTDNNKNPTTDPSPSVPGGNSSYTPGSPVKGSGQVPSSSASATDSVPAIKDPLTNPSATASPVKVSPSITLQSSLKGISILSANAKNTYKLYTKKKIRLTVPREADTDYYYKVLRKGQTDSQGNWKKMNTDRLMVSGSTSSAKGQRILLKAVNKAGSTVKKTTGFVIDTRKPTIKGVKNGVFYRKKCSIRVSDNCGSCNVHLNGKKMKRNFVIKKRGIYLLTTSDPAGNQRNVLFAIL